MLEFKEKYNVNPKGKKTGDCVVRAIAYASNRSWEEVFTELNKISVKVYSMPNEKNVYEKYLADLGFSKMPQPKKSNGTKYLVGEIDKLIDTNKYDVVISMANHLTCADSNNLIDIWDCRKKTIGNYYTRRKEDKPKLPNNSKDKAVRYYI